jgi:MFS family permease
MSWKIAILVAFLTAVITGAVTAFVADHVTKAMKVSNFEGGRGYAVMFLILGALIGGVIIGLVTTGAVGAVDWGHFWKAQGWSLLASNGIVFTIAGLCLLSVPKQLLMDGELIALKAEIFVPDDLGPTGPPNEKDLYLSLYAGKDDNHYVDIDTNRLRHEEGMLVIPVEADLNTVSPGRMLSLTVNDSIGYTLDMPLQPAPRKEDLAWTERLPMRLSKVSNVKYEYTRVLVRYRVVKKGKPVKD